MNICAKYMPEEKTVSSSHRASCWMMDERAAKGGVALAYQKKILEVKNLKNIFRLLKNNS